MTPTVGYASDLFHRLSNDIFRIEICVGSSVQKICARSERSGTVTCSVHEVRTWSVQQVMRRLDHENG